MNCRFIIIHEKWIILRFCDYKRIFYSDSVLLKKSLRGQRGVPGVIEMSKWFSCDFVWFYHWMRVEFLYPFRWIQTPLVVNNDNSRDLRPFRFDLHFLTSKITSCPSFANVITVYCQSTVTLSKKLIFYLQNHSETTKLKQFFNCPTEILTPDRHHIYHKV